jgi:HEAT repeat protein
MNTINRASLKRVGLLALLGAILCLPPEALAFDTRVLRLGSLLDRADVILIGVVTRVDPGPNGSQLATIAVQEPLRGSAPGTFTLPGSTTDPSRPAFANGAEFLLFLRATTEGLAPVDGLNGVMAVSSGRLAATRALVLEWINRGQAVRLADMRDDAVVQDAPAPPVLIASMLDEMTERLAPADFTLVVQMACNGAGEFLPAAQQWAILRVGPFKLSDARPCLEQILASDESLGSRLAASETLGVLGDKRSLRVLQEIVAAAEGQDEDAGGRRNDGGLSLSAVLALGKIRDPRIVPDLTRLARKGGDFALHSTVVDALGLIGGRRVIGPLTSISRTHPNPLIRQQAKETLEQIKP